MPFKPAILLTDALVYLLLTAIVVFAIYAARHKHLRTPWQQVVRRPMAMGALTVLLTFAAVGLLDSIHYQVRLPDESRQFSPEVRSVLDALLAPLKAQTEKTYSAPFSTHAHTRETVQQPDGTLARITPRLRYGGSHLEAGASMAKDVIGKSAQATVVALSVWLPIALWLAWRLRVPESGAVAGWRRLWRGDTDIPWRTILITTGVLLVVTANLAWLSAYYHVFGTDQVGQDVLYKSLKSIRTGLVIGTLTTLVMLPFALFFGILAGYARGLIDDAIQYVYTTLSSIPDVLLIAAS